MPHVMKYSEIIKAASDGEIIYEENRTLGLVRPLKFDGVDFIGVKHNCYLPLEKCRSDCRDYNLFYRCWNGEPTEELIHSTPWKDLPHEE